MSFLIASKCGSGLHDACHASFSRVYRCAFNEELHDACHANAPSMRQLKCPILIFILLFEEQIRNLTGKAAPASILQLITWIAVTHDDRIEKIETVMAVRTGTRYVAEVCGGT